MKRRMAEEAYQESLQTLSDWLGFLDGKEREIKAQLTRLKKKEQKEGTGGASETQAEADGLAWLDQGPPSTGDEAPASPAAPPPPPAPQTAEQSTEPDVPDWLND